MQIIKAYLKNKSINLKEQIQGYNIKVTEPLGSKLWEKNTN